MASGCSWCCFSVHSNAASSSNEQAEQNQPVRVKADSASSLTSAEQISSNASSQSPVIGSPGTGGRRKIHPLPFAVAQPSPTAVVGTVIHVSPTPIPNPSASLPALAVFLGNKNHSSSP